MPQQGKGPSEDAVRGQLREERARVAGDASDDNGSTTDVAAEKRAMADADVAKVEAARSAEARMATESASAVESADAAGRGAEPDQGQTARGDLSAAAVPDEAEEDVRAERDRYLDLAKRTQADFDNYRRRAATAGTRAKAGLVRELLPVVDNLERAIASATDGDSGVVQGVKLVHADLVGVLERNGIVADEPSGRRFDPTEHEAVSMRTEEGAEPGIVLDVVEKGYRLNDTIIRPARVVVSG
jgi:molecular chaperone GrpE